MSGKAVVITSGKGGVGKTTTTANLGVALALEGKSVVLLDADIGLRNLDVVLGLENRIVYDIVNVIDGMVDFRKALIKDKRVEGLYLLPAAQTRDKDAVSPEQMRKLIEDIKTEFDYVLIDCPAGIEQGFLNAIVGADEAVVVVTPEVSSVRDADRVVGLLDKKGEIPMENISMLVNRIRMDMVRKKEMLDVSDIEELLRIKVLGVIPDDESVIVSTNKGEPVVLNGKNHLAQAYRDAAGRILGREIPFEEKHQGFVGTVLRFFGLAE
jgi:septum site-determining protein MinD